MEEEGGISPENEEQMEKLKAQNEELQRNKDLAVQKMTTQRMMTHELTEKKIGLDKDKDKLDSENYKFKDKIANTLKEIDNEKKKTEKAESDAKSKKDEL